MQGELLANPVLEDMGIPAVEHHLHTLTVPPCQKVVKSNLDRLSRLARGISLALGEATELPMTEQECFRKTFHAEVAVGLHEV